MSSSDDSEDDYSFAHWNNWTPSASTSQKNQSEDIPNVSANKSKIRASVFSQKSSDRFGNYIPPNSWKNRKRNTLCIKKITTKQIDDINKQSVEGKKNNVLNWANRRNFFDLNDLPEKSCIWNIVNPGVFNKLNLWLNKYGHICGTAQGKVMKPGCKDGAVLVIEQPDLLRKLLGVTAFEWASLCDLVKDNKLQLNYDAYVDYNLSKLSSVEKLWVILCKRRHLIPSVCVTFSINGAIKVMKEFQIFPKLVIKEVYDVEGNDIQ